MVYNGYAGGRRRYVGDDRIRAVGQGSGDLGEAFGLGDVAADGARAVERLDRREVNSDDFCAEFKGNLRPTPGRCSKIKHCRAAMDEAKAAVDLLQLVRRPRAIAVALRLAKVLVLGLLLTPGGGQVYCCLYQ